MSTTNQKAILWPLKRRLDNGIQQVFMLQNSGYTWRTWSWELWTTFPCSCILDQDFSGHNKGALLSATRHPGLLLWMRRGCRWADAHSAPLIPGFICRGHPGLPGCSFNSPSKFLPTSFILLYTPPLPGALLAQVSTWHKLTVLKSSLWGFLWLPCKNWHLRLCPRTLVPSGFIEF